MHTHTQYWILFDFWLCFLVFVSFYVSEMCNPFAWLWANYPKFCYNCIEWNCLTTANNNRLTNTHTRTHSVPAQSLCDFQNDDSIYYVSGSGMRRQRLWMNNELIPIELCRCVYVVRISNKSEQNAHSLIAIALHWCCLFTFKITMNGIKHASNPNCWSKIVENHLRRLMLSIKPKSTHFPKIVTLFGNVSFNNSWSNGFSWL